MKDARILIIVENLISQMEVLVMNRYFVITTSVVIFLFLGSVANSAGPTEVSGVFSNDTTWELANSPYIVKGSMNVASGVTLTIEAGVVVKFDGQYDLVVDGALIAKGTEEKVITFTSNSFLPTAGSWGRIHFRDSSVDSECELSHSIIQYGTEGIRCDSASPKIANNIISDISSDGIVVSNGSPGIAENSISKISNGNGIWLSNSSSTVDSNVISSISGGWEDKGNGVLASSGSATISNNTIAELNQAQRMLAA